MVGIGAKGATWALGGAYSPPHGASASSLLGVLGAEPGGPPLDGASLTVALDVVQAWAVLITIGFTLVLFFFLAFCVCAKKDDGYDEFELTQGITTVKVCHDGGENGLGSYPRINGAHSPKGSDEASEASSRCTLKRELPAIPLSAQPDPASIECKVERTQSQHSSDLYAAVGDGNDSSSMAKLIGGVQVLPAGAIGPSGRAAVVRDPNATSPTDHADPRSPTGGPGAGSPPHPYAKVKKDHPYAHVKLPKKDHPYAKVIRDDSEDPETDTDNYDDPKAITKDKSGGWTSEAAYEPAPPVPEKRFDLEEEPTLGAAPSESGGGLMTTSATSGSSAKGPSSPRSPHLSISASATSPTSPHSVGPSTDRSPSVDIPAAMAISGRTPANEELPYMTPPLQHPPEAGIELPAQQNFSGDSQDSRGYTSISVREPLAALKAQTQSSTQTQSNTSAQPVEGEGYYMTVSDDSADEMYACIYEGTRGVGSETYAQIEPRSTPPPPPPPMPSPPHAPSTPSPLSTRGGSQPPPAPPSVDSLRHVVHSRQASSSSAASTVMGSPGAEKRGTRSPLPPVPQGDTSLYSAPSPQPPHSPPRSVPALERPTQRALEEMYAKVMKKQRPGHSRGSSAGGGGGGESDAGSGSSSRRGSVDVTSGGRWGSHASSPPTTPRQSLDLGAMTHSLIETRNHEVVSSISRAKSYEATGVWSSAGTHHPQPAPTNPNYETIPQLPANFYSGGSSDPGYETVKNSEPPYASVERPEENYPGYETVKPTSDIESEPGYETLKHHEYEPGYETVTGKMKQAVSEPGYETVAHKTSHEDAEPGYETVTHKTEETADPGYEIVKGKTASESGDPGYEELQGAIHHVRTTSEHDPNYEQLKFTSGRSSEGDAEPGYEVVKKVETESTYEFVRDYETQEPFPPYEKIDKTEKATDTPVMPVYASVIRKETSPEKKELSEQLSSFKARGLLESDLDMYPGSTGEQGSKVVESKSSPPSQEKSPSPPLKKSPVSKSPPSKISPDKPSVPSIKSPDRASPPSVKSPDKASATLVKNFDKGSPPQMKSPDKGSPPLKKNTDKSSPPRVKSPDKGSPPLVKSPDKEYPPLMKSRDKSSPPRVKSPDKGSPPLVKSPVKESPPLMKSPDQESPPMMKSPDSSPPLMKSPDSSPPMVKSPDKESPPPMKSPDKGSPPQTESPDKGSPPQTKSPDKGSPPVVKSPEKSSPMVIGSEAKSTPTVEIPNKENSKYSFSLPGISSSRQSPPLTESPGRKSSSPASSSPAQSPPSVAKSPINPTGPILQSFNQESSPLQENLSKETSSPTKDIAQQPSPPLTESPPKEQFVTFQESPSVQPSQELLESPTKQESSNRDSVEELILSTGSESFALDQTAPQSDQTTPTPPPITVTDEDHTVIYDTFGLVDATLPGSAADTQDQPEETVNPLYIVDSELPQEEASVPEHISPAEEESQVGLCGELPPPPPPVIEDEESEFPNDLPPPLPEVTAISHTNMVEDTPPPPLVPPSDVEGLDDLLNLANMGSSSSGSTAGQPGSAHGNSDKDSDSPQESEVMHLEGTTAEELPPPPPPPEPEGGQDSDEELDNSVSSGYELGFTAGGITVTVNPMADMEEEKEDSPLPSLQPPPPPPPAIATTTESCQVAPPSPVAAIISSSGGSQSSSSGSGSQDTGSGSVESVVTVECAAGDAAIHGRQRSSDSSSSPESRHLDPHEQITEV